MTAVELLTTCRQAEILAVLRPAEFVTLRNGPTSPLPVLQLAWSLEDRGFTLSLTPGGTLTVAPTNALSDADRTAIHRWRQHLMALTDYVERITEEPV